MKYFIVYSVLYFLLITKVSTQSYEDKRCRCICPSPAAVLNKTGDIVRKLIIANAPPSQCNCDGVVLPNIGNEVKGREQEYCPRCDCRYETRNTTIIKVVVITVLWILALLIIYMGFLSCLDPLMPRRKYKSYYEDKQGEASRSLLQNIEDAGEF